MVEGLALLKILHHRNHGCFVGCGQAVAQVGAEGELMSATVRIEAGPASSVLLASISHVHRLLLHTVSSLGSCWAGVHRVAVVNATADRKALDDLDTHGGRGCCAVARMSFFFFFSLFLGSFKNNRRK